ncbi:MAG: ABC transporter ATP-binding protein [Candidatus Omnitrophica bacterium]|nr:ABC transporter ATP-binding protein [Candidatus Omnitrophota bacterium]
MSLLSVENLSVSLFSDNEKKLLSEVSFSIEKGEIVCLVGGSGSGKTMSAYSIMGLLPFGIKITKGNILYKNNKLTPANIMDFRAKKIGMIFQEPFSALNPVMQIGEQIEEIFKAHGCDNKKENKQKALELLSKVKMKDPCRVFTEYPHNLSGGQRQRVIIAMAISLKPELLIADEPTTSLDVNVQADILELLCELKEEMNIAILFITHDLGIVNRIGQKVIVIDQGKVIEQGTKQEIFCQPKREYTKKLLIANNIGQKTHSFLRPASPICEVKQVSRKFISRSGLFYGREYVIKALEKIDLSVAKGSITAIVGESGSGKSTLGRIIACLDKPDSGRVFLNGKDINQINRAERANYVQMVFQDPCNSFDPRFKIKDILLESFYKKPINKDQKNILLNDIMREVGLLEKDLYKYPHEFSGGQRQRIAIARALLKDPYLLVLDEPVSSLDLIVQKDIIDLLAKIKEEKKISYVLISHNIKLVENIADYVYIINNGYIIEHGPVKDVFSEPNAEYTKTLIRNSL